MTASLNPLDKREELKASFFAFVQHFWTELIAEVPHYNWHIRYLCEQLQKVAQRAIARQGKRYDLIVNLPPGTTKSTLVSQMYPAWVWACDPTQRFICGSYAQSIAQDQAERCRRLVKSEAYQRLFPEVKIDRSRDSKGHFALVQGGERYSTSVGSAVTGIHAHQIIVDDPINPQQAHSAQGRKVANEWLGRTLVSRKVDQRTCPMLLVMQRLHVEDCSGYLLAKGGKYRHLSLPAEKGEAVKPKSLAAHYKKGLLDPVRLPEAVLRNLKRDMGTADYNAQMLQTPVPLDGGILKAHWFGQLETHQLGQGSVDFFLDTAYTSQQSNDPTALMAAVSTQGKLLVLDVESRWLEFPELIRHIRQYVQRWGGGASSRVFVEPKASGLSIVQQLRTESQLNVVKALVPKEERLTRVHQISPLVEAGRVKLLKGSWNDDFIAQCAAFPNGKHDDELDTLVMAVNTLLLKKGRKVFL